MRSVESKHPSTLASSFLFLLLHASSARVCLCHCHLFLLFTANIPPKPLLTDDLPSKQLLNTCSSSPPFDHVHSTVAISRDKSNSPPPTIIIYRSISEPWPVQTSPQVQGHLHDQVRFNSLFLPRSSIHAPPKRTTTDPPHLLTTKMNSQAQCKRQLEAPAKIECLLAP